MRFVSLILLASAGCVTPASTFVCASSADCSGGTCELDGFCSFADAACDSGRRYGDASGDKSGTCVDGGGGNDVCGDGMVTGTEECEDGNTVVTDFCVDCKFAVCGDGNVLAGVEECDDGNIADGDGCAANCLDCGTNSATDPTTGHCYRVIENAVDWTTAANDCAAQDGYLASIGDAAENAFVTALLVNPQYWIGLDNRSNGFRWQNEDTLGAFVGWGTNEPSAGVSDDCTGLSMVGTWDAQLCSTTFPYVCERELPFVEPTTRHIYRRFLGRREINYQQAVTACASLTPPAHLVTITDQAEQDVVDSISGASRLWIGLDDTATEGSFVWVSGEISSFFAWNTGEPDVVNAAIEDTTILREDGFWQTRDGTTVEPYICEIDPAP